MKWTELKKEIEKIKNKEEREMALERLNEMMKQYEGDDQVVSSEELYEIHQNLPQKEKFYTGFEQLDGIMEGFELNESIFLSGLTKHGKTTFAMELSERFSERGLKPLWLSFEERPIDLIRKFKERTGEIPKFFTPKKNEVPNLEWVEAKILEAKAKYDAKVVFIDHIGFISDWERQGGESEAQRLERIARAIHRFAVSWDVLIFFLGHLRKTKTDQMPDLEDIKGSSAIAQESDAVFIVWRRNQKRVDAVDISNETTLSIQANRRSGKTGNIKFIYDEGRFEEVGTNNEEVLSDIEF